MPRLSTKRLSNGLLNTFVFPGYKILIIVALVGFISKAVTLDFGGAYFINPPIPAEGSNNLIPPSGIIGLTNSHILFTRGSGV